MMTVFVDTSALFALLVRDDAMHVRAREAFTSLARREAQLLTSSYVLVETTALLQRRVGLTSVRDFNAKVFPLLEIVWVDTVWHARAMQRLFDESSRNLSLVDCLSFEIMEVQEITEAFAFDQDFTAQGFTITYANRD